VTPPTRAPRRITLSELGELPSFALLGPGFGRGTWVLATDLVERSGSGQLPDRPTDAPRLVLCPFESPGGAPSVWEIGSLEAVDPILDAPSAQLGLELDDAGYLENVETIREWIAAGDVYQVCYTLRAVVRASRSPDDAGAELLSRLCRLGPPPFAAWSRLPGQPEFVTASPELLLAVSGRRAHSSPMKGTARLGEEASLGASAKDRAELAMITDLVRNDLTPVCLPRSVSVACPRRPVPLPYALQTVSDVVGELSDHRTALDALASLHPGGSVTGTPKSTALQAIRKLESTERGPYCGALGLLAGDRAVIALLIRTAWRTEPGWTYGVGSGIVYDSDGPGELAELHVKLGALA
jgi:para-aminobenzoate synthetase component 1